MLPPPAAAPTPPHVPLSQKTWRNGTLTYTFGGLVVLFLLLLLGDFAWSMRERSVGPMAQWYLSDLKVPNSLFLILTGSLPALIGLILGPIISVRSDRHRGKWGRRIPYLLVTTPFAALGMLGLGCSPFIAEWAHSHLAATQPFGHWLQEALGHGTIGTWIYSHAQDKSSVAVLCFGIFWTAYEFAAIAGSPVFYGLINDVVPRPLLGRFHGLFRAVSLIDGMIFSWWILGIVPHYFAIIMITVGTFFGLCFMTVCLCVKEGEYPPAPPAPSTNGLIGSAVHEVKKYSTECFGSSYYIAVFLLLMIAGFAFMPVNNLTMPFIKSLDVNLNSYGHCVTLTYFLSLTLSFPLGWLADKFHPLRMVMVTLIAYLFVGLYGGFFATTPNQFLVSWVFHGFVSGCYYTSVASLGQRLFPHARYAQFASAVGILGSLTSIFFLPCLGKFIDWTGPVYRYTFFIGAIIAAIALLLSFYVYARFIALGGPKAYVAPE